MENILNFKLASSPKQQQHSIMEKAGPPHGVLRDLGQVLTLGRTGKDGGRDQMSSHTQHAWQDAQWISAPPSTHHFGNTFQNS